MSQIIESSLPMVIQKQEQETAINYRVFGNESGVIVETGNLFDKNATDASNGYLANTYLNSAGNAISSENWDVSEYIPVNASIKYTLFSGVYDLMYICFYTNAKTYISGVLIGSVPLVVTIPENASFTRISVRKSSRDIVMFLLGEYAERPSYIPPEYKIPLTLTSGVTENLYDWTAPLVVSERYLNENGEQQISASFGITDYLPVLGGTIYTLSGITGSNPACCFYNKNNEFIEGIRFSSRHVITFTTPVNATKIKLSVNINTESDYYHAYTMLVLGSTAPDHYIPHRYTTDYDLYIGNTKLGAEEYVDFNEQKIYKRTANLLNDALATENVPVISSGKEIYMAVSGYLGVFIPVEPSTRYTGWNLAITTASNNRYIFFCDANKNILGHQEYSVTSNPKPINTTADTAYICVPVRDTLLGVSAMVTKGTAEPETFLPYYIFIEPPSPFPSITSYIGENTFNSTEAINKMRIEFNEGFIYEGKDISQFHINNQFYDLVDSSFYSLIADDFNSLTSYSEGDFCIYNYQLYKCLFATQGDWISECWELISLADLIQGDGQEVGVDDDTWRIIYEICNGTLSDNLVIDYDYIKGGKFAYCDMSTIELPNCSRISHYTFYNCKNLSFISAPNCTSIGAYAFNACDALVSYNMPLISVIEYEAFRACITLPLASFSQNLQIGSRAFLGCTSLSEVNMPSVSIIYSDAFSGCTALTTLELPGCLSIYSYALRNCTKLETASFPNLVRIYSSGFAGCAKLMSLYLLSTKMCTLQNANAFGGTPISVSTGGIYGSIYVPSALVESYKVATGWVTYANRFVAYQE